MPEERDRAGRFFLKSRGPKGFWRICWYDRTSRGRQTASIATGTQDRELARQALAEHFLKCQTAAPRQDAPLTELMQTYFIKYAQFLPSIHVQRAAMRDALDVWGDPNTNELGRDKQMELVNALRARNLSDWTIQGRLNRIWAAINWCHRGKMITQVPAQITAADWKPYLPDNEQTYSIEELAALFNACKPGDARYSREHWRRFLVLAITTCARVSALRELKWDQFDERVGRIYLNPEGRRQNNKRRAIVPVGPTLARELATWERDSEYVITYYGKPLATREFYDRLAAEAGMTGGPNVIRHTVRTFLAEVGVPDAEADLFMGHKGEGSHTGARYTHRRPEYLKSVKQGIELLFEALSEFVERPFVGWELIDQPVGDDALRVERVSSDLTCLRNLLNFGAGNETRTRDPDLGKVVLYQLSYSRTTRRRNCMWQRREVKADRLKKRAKNRIGATT